METWATVGAKRARTAETPKLPSYDLRLRAPYFYPDHREVRQDKYVELWFGELDRNRCRYRLWCRGAHRAMASWEAE
jgi:hypothetical protein